MNTRVKKAAFTAISIPFMYKTNWAYNWQMDRKKWKESLIEERSVKLSVPVKEIKLEEVESLPTEPEALAKFQDKWMYRPLVIKGVFDHDKEEMVNRTRDGDRGYDVITPLYTDVNGKTGGL
jgi:cytochrome oxidase assembly protein ShyY1